MELCHALSGKCCGQSLPQKRAAINRASLMTECVSAGTIAADTGARRCNCSASRQCPASACSAEVMTAHDVACCRATVIACGHCLPGPLWQTASRWAFQQQQVQHSSSHFWKVEPHVEQLSALLLDAACQASCAEKHFLGGPTGPSQPQSYACSRQNSSIWTWASGNLMAARLARWQLDLPSSAHQRAHQSSRTMHAAGKAATLTYACSRWNNCV